MFIFSLAVLVWLNYKNAYEYWNEQRLALNKEVRTATQQVIDRLPIQQATPALGTLFLQLTVDDLGICVPMSTLTPVSFCLLKIAYPVPYFQVNILFV